MKEKVIPRLTKNERRELVENKILEHLKQADTMDYPEKIKVLVKNCRLNGEFYEFRFGVLAELLKYKDEIKDWFPIPKNDILDHLKVDFIIVTNDCLAAPLQVTSSAAHAQRMRKEVRRVYNLQKGGQPLFPVISFKTLTKKDRSETEVLNLIVLELEKSFLKIDCRYLLGD